MNKLECKHVIELVREMGRIIIANEKEFCDLDSVAGDGDFGMSLAKGFRALNDEWDDLIEYRIRTEQECLYGQAG